MDYRYPIGQYEIKPFSEAQKNEWLYDIAYLPQRIESAIINLDAAQLHTPYRDGGWTIQQVVHHVADSHINAYTRFKNGLTENNPTIKPYLEAEWALLPDVEAIPINVSITILHALHLRMHATIKHLTDAQWERTVLHPEHQKTMSLWYLLGLYAWHGKHHTAHITKLRERMGW